MDNKDKIILFLSALCFVLICALCYVLAPEDESEDLIRSQEREKALVIEKKRLENKYDSLLIVDMKLKDSLEQIGGERIKIEYKYYEKTADIVSLNADSSIRYCSSRLSEVNLN